jgi:hypothetical protein
MHHIKIATALCLFWGFALSVQNLRAASTPEAGDLTLVAQGRPQAVIVLPDKPVKAERLAAAELNEHIELITGAKLPVLQEKEASTELNGIFVGATVTARKNGFSPGQFGEQEYAVKFISRGVILAGKDKRDTGSFRYRVIDKTTGLDAYDSRSWPKWWDERGTLQAAYEFLRSHCGVRWFDFTECGTDYTPRQTLAVKAVDVRRRPSFLMRDVFTERSAADYPAACLLWASKSDEFGDYVKLAFPEITEKCPEAESRHKRDLIKNKVYAYLLRNGNGGTGYCHPNHSLYDYYARFWQRDKRFPEAFEESKPECFAKGYAGKKPPQLCYTNAKLVEQAAKDAADFFDDKPFGIYAKTGRGKQKWEKMRLIAPNYYPVVPMDNHSYCQCETCRKWRGRYTGDAYADNKGMFSDYVFQFVNQVAKRVKKTHPGRKVGTLAYAMYMDTPPNVELEDNIMVMACPVLRNVYSESRQRADREMLRRWSATGVDLYLWLYYCFPHERSIRGGGNWHVFPGFFAHHLAQSLREYKGYGCRGMYFNGFGQEVEAYVTFRLLNDVTLDADRLLDEYFMRMFGPAGPALRKLYCRIEEIYCDPRNYPQMVADRSRQNEEIAWGMLGSHKRMTALAGLIREARLAIKTAGGLQQKRFQLFDLSVLRYVEEGRRKYLAKHSKPRMISHICCAPLLEPSKNGNPDRIDWQDAQELGIWASEFGEPLAVTPRAKVAHDGQFLYLHLRATSPEGGSNNKQGASWRVMFMRKAGGNLTLDRDIRIPDTGNASDSRAETGALKLSVDTATNTIKLALPLTSLPRNAGTVYLNLARSAPGQSLATLMPTMGEENAPGSFVAVKLDMAIERPGETSDDKLIARWDFSGTGNIICDSSPEARNKSVLNNEISTRKPSPFGGSLELDRRLGCEFFDVSDWSGTADTFTLVAWLKINPVPGVMRGKLPYTLLSFANGEITIGDYRLKIRQKTPGLKLTTDRLLSPDEWEHVTVTANRTGTRLYINGRCAGTSTKRFGLPAAGALLRIGADQKQRHHCQYRGDLARIAIFNRSMSAGEAMARYREGLRKIKNYRFAEMSTKQNPEGKTK